MPNDEKQIEELFARASSNYAGAGKEVQNIFSMLIKETLVYRDELKNSGGKVLSVNEVEEALNHLEGIIIHRHVPTIKNPNVVTLLDRFIKKLSKT